MNQEVKTDFQNGIERINKLIISVYPEIDKTLIDLIDAEVISIVRQTILNIGNNINSLTKEITY